MKDGEFHPFGNPYLRYNEDTGFIQMLLEDGTWKNVYCPFSLPETKRLYLVKNGKLTKNYGGFVGTGYRWSGMTGYNQAYPTITGGDGVATYKGNGSNSIGAVFTNGTTDFSQYSSLNIAVSSVSGSGYILPIITPCKIDNYAITLAGSNISTVGTHTVNISNITDFEYIALATYNSNLVFGISDIWLE